MGMTGPKRGNSRRSGRGHHRPDGAINVTPFVDVLLILLVVFMVVSTALPGSTSKPSFVVSVHGEDEGLLRRTKRDSRRVDDDTVFRGTKDEVTKFILVNIPRTQIVSYRGLETVPYTTVEEWAHDLISAGHERILLRLRRKKPAAAPTAEDTVD